MIAGTDITFSAFDSKRIELAKQGFDGNSEAIKHFGLEKTPWPSEDEIPFADASEISEDAANAMAWAAEEELLFVENGNLRPTDPVTRAELASMLVRFYEKFMVN